MAFNPQQKKHTKKSKRDPKYLKWIKTQPCCNPNCPGNCGDIVPAHMSILGNAGTSTKAPDNEALPLGYFCHADQHEYPVSFWDLPVDEIIDFVQRLCDEHWERFMIL